MNNIKFLNLGAESGSVELYIYGEIMDENEPDFWTGEKSELVVDIPDFKAAIDQIRPGQTLNIYFNSPGGSVFVASAMCSMLARLKDKGSTINAYIDGAAISAASMLVMAADNIYVYQNSMMMIHRPMTCACGNVNDMESAITMLKQVETGAMMPLYMAHAKGSEDDIKNMLAAETWMTADDIVSAFGAERLEGEKQVAAFDRSIFARYKNVPKSIDNDMSEFFAEISAKLDKLAPKEKRSIDYSSYENTLKTL